MLRKAITGLYAPLRSIRAFATEAAAKKNTTKLKEMIRSPQLEFLMEAHNGLSAKIVSETGFKGIWASGLSISASLGVRDANEASWTQIVDVLEFMVDSSKLPILLDGDTGFGNYNNARRLVRKLESRGVAGVCLEDKVFPKQNSLLEGGRKEQLASIEEFSKKIEACKDYQQDPDFQVVARVEAFIAGWGLEEALKRAEAYRKAGADAILIHSKKTDSAEIESFVKEWKNRHPLIIVPTKYYKTPTQTFRDWNVSVVIWANHNMRACISAMKETSKKIFDAQSLVPVEKNIVPVTEVFRLQNNDELVASDKKYLPPVQD
eukprot:TRINITY_DN540_c0_g1_i1.p11 TRINITY_DN540_c0_g1~~TRINITY_DN540_c0_g1_i1.p11  ORF type:complete len:320 (+),score=37.27 TRINITY_DN540_c0_g1_i1:1485-2444(+)